MNIATSKLFKGRRIYRAVNKDIGVGYAYRDRPMLTFYIDGSDGVRYLIELDRHDLDQITEARGKYKEHFTPKV